MPDLSVLIAARNEQFLARTVQDVLANMRGDTDIIVVLDGKWADPPLADHPRVRIVYRPEPIGQRAAVNLAARWSKARYVVKLDAHCSVAEGFDVTLVEDGDKLGHDVTQIARMYNLHVFDRICKACGHRMYQGPMVDPCEACKATEGFEREMIWQPRWNRRTDFARFDHDLHFQYQGPRKAGQEKREIADLMSSVGAMFCMRRDRFWELGGLDESHGSWGQFGVEIACKSWLSGGRQVVNKRTWFSHLFRTNSRGFSFPYEMIGADQARAKKYSQDLWLGNRWRGQVRPLAWLIDYFAPIRGWHDPIGAGALQRVREAADAFRVGCASPSAEADHASPIASGLAGR